MTVQAPTLRVQLAEAPFIRDEAVRAVDAIHAYTFEFAPDISAHLTEYIEVEIDLLNVLSHRAVNPESLATLEAIIATKYTRSPYCPGFFHPPSYPVPDTDKHQAATCLGCQVDQILSSFPR